MSSNLRSIVIPLSVSVALLSASVAPCRTCIDPGRVAVALESPSTCVAVATLPGIAGTLVGDATLEGVDPALHGVAEWNDEEICYTPDDRFWSLGSDSFTYRYSLADEPGSIHTGIVQLIAGHAVSMSFSDRFDVSLDHCGWDVHDPDAVLSIVEDPPLSGRRFLQVGANTDEPAFLSLDAVPSATGHYSWPEICTPALTEVATSGFFTRTGTTDDCFCIEFADIPQFEGEMTVWSADFGDPSTPAESVEIRLRGWSGPQSGPPEVQAVWNGGTPCGTSWTQLSSDNATLELDVWGGEQAGMMLRVDARNAVIERCAGMEIGGLTQVRAGLVATSGGTMPPFRVDDLAIGERNVRWPWRTQPLIETFECDDAAWSPYGRWVPVINGDAAISGLKGLEIDLGAIAASGLDYGYLHGVGPADPTTFNLRLLLDPQDVALADGDEFILAGGLDSDFAGERHLLLKVGGTGGGDLEIWAEDRGGAQPRLTQRLALDRDVHAVELQWRASSEPGAEDGSLRLSIDGVELGTAEGLDNAGRRVDGFHIGGISVPPGAQRYLFVDNVETWDTSAPPVDVVAVDDFETGDISLWDGSYVPSGGSLTVTPAAALEGTFGLEVEAVDSSTYVFLQNDVPAAERRLEVSFGLDPNSLPMVEGSDHVVFSAISDTPGVVFNVQLGVREGSYALRAIVFIDGGGHEATGWLPIPDGPTAVWLTWRAPTAPGEEDGRLDLSIDGGTMVALRGLDTDSKLVDALRLGIAGGLDPTTNGTFFLDEFRVWKPQ